MRLNLPELQNSLYQLIAAPDGTRRIHSDCRPAPSSAELSVRGDARLGAIDRPSTWGWFAVGGDLECVEEVANELVEADGDDEVGELSDGEDL